ncbi:MAG TPA: PDZ domain-containing protein [Gemmatimonadaceae bacterium]|nr:PDZ domain-containing protein [Gemmatimonadaceae bacterium]
MLRPLALCALATVALAARPSSAAAQGPARGAAAAPVVSVPISDVRYTLTFTPATARERKVEVAMRFATGGDGPVVLSLPAWTPGAYEISNFARWVSSFAATGDGKPLAWDKLDYDSWRIESRGAKSIVVSFDYTADTLDNAMAWSRPDFLLVNGTNVFLYPEGRGFDWGATVTVATDPGWHIATGMSPAPAPSAGPARSFTASNYHDLVDMPFFIGRFDLDSMRISDRWVRFATYPAGMVAGTARRQVWDQLAKMIPQEVKVFGEAPWTTYTVMQIADSSYGGASGLEHQNSHVDVISPAALGHPFMPSLYAHEIFHSWNVKRLRPADLWPYQYAHEQPTPWLWVSEGITDYYADLAEVRGGVIDSTGFFDLTAGKIQEVADAPPVALEDASLSTWIHPVDGTGYLYYPKGSLAGLMLDIMIRDASDNRRSLDDVMRQLYREDYKAGRGFTGEDWWRAVSAAANGKSFDEVYRRYIDGRDPFPWRTLLPLAGMRYVVDTVREPRLGVNTLETEQGLIVSAVDPEGAAAAAGVRPGDVLLTIGDISVADGDFPQKFTEKYGARVGAPLPIRVRRGNETVTLNGTVRLRERTQAHVEALSGAPAKAARIRSGILRGTVDR